MATHSQFPVVILYPCLNISAIHSNERLASSLGYPLIIDENPTYRNVNECNRSIRKI
ncbi:hypothetical protein PILCRDRAFT_822348, partial [Piloderma croceum F 1598]